MKRLIIYLSLLFFLISCGVSKDFDRTGKDKRITSDSNLDLKGKFLDSGFTETKTYEGSLWQMLSDSYDTTHFESPIFTQIDPVGKKLLNVSLHANGKKIEETHLKGKYKKGYFISKKLKLSLQYGVILTITYFKKRIGVTNENTLVALNYRSTIALLVFFPIGGTDNGFERFFYKVN